MSKHGLRLIVFFSLVYFINSDLFDHLDEESEFSNDMIENIHLVSII